MVDTLLDRATFSEGSVRDGIIQELASQPEKTLPSLIEAAVRLPKHRQKAALEVLMRIGYPGNATAIPAMVDHVCDLNSPGRGVAIRALTSIDPRTVVPYLVEAMWPPKAVASSWPSDVEGICAMLVEVAGEFARLCGPTIASILARPVDLDNPDRSFLVDVIEYIGVRNSDYAIPALVYTGRVTKHRELADRIWQLLHSYPSANLSLYSRILGS